MKLGVIADIHSNLDALQAVLQAEVQVNAWLCAGDLVGYYLDCEEVCRKMQKINVHVIRGNHDAYVTGALIPAEENADLYRTTACRSALSFPSAEWLASLPIESTFVINGFTIILRHASPWDETTYIYPDSQELMGRLAIAKSEILILGHTHHPLIKDIGQGRLLNPGSVGQPRDGLPSASYAVIDTHTGDIVLKRADYDTTAYSEKLRNAGVDERVIRYFETIR